MASNDVLILPTKTQQQSPGNGFRCTRAHALTAAIVCAYFGSALLMFNSTKFVYTEYGFKFPLFLSFLHMLLSGGVARGFCHYVLRQYNVLSRRDQVQKIVPLAICQALSIASSNTALKFLYPSFLEMAGCTLPIFTVAATIVLTGQTYTRVQFSGVSIIVLGGVLCSAAEPNNSVLGLIFCFTSLLFKSIKTTLQARLLNGERMDSMTLLMYAAPYQCVVYLVGTIAVEGLQPVRALRAAPSTMLLATLILSSMVTCIFNVTSFMTISRFSAVGFVILGLLKTPLDIVASVVLFRNQVTPTQMFGCLLMYFGAAVFNGLLVGKLPSYTENSRRRAKLFLLCLFCVAAASRLQLHLWQEENSKLRRLQLLLWQRDDDSNAAALSNRPAVDFIEPVTTHVVRSMLRRPSVPPNMSSGF